MHEFAQLHSICSNKRLHDCRKSVFFVHEILNLWTLLLHYFFQKLNIAVVVLVCWTRFSLFLVCFCIPAFPVCFHTPLFFDMCTCLMYEIYWTNFASFTNVKRCSCCLGVLDTLQFVSGVLLHTRLSGVLPHAFIFWYVHMPHVWNILNK